MSAILEARHTLGGLAVRLNAAAKISQQRRPQLLTAIGAQTASWVVQDYVAKSRHGADAAGKTWADIQPETVKNRIRRLAPYRRLRDRLKALSQQARQIRTGKVGARKLSEGSKAKRLKQIEASRAKIREQIEALYAAALGQYAIGIDTGRLINSLVFGRPELAKIRVRPPQGTDKQPAVAVLDVKADSVTIGSNQEYAHHFDEKRPIISAGMITTERRKGLEQIALEFAAKCFRDAVKGGSQ